MRKWQIKNRILTLDKHSVVMGILNVTPDSFSDGGWHQEVEQAVNHAQNMIREGAGIIDIGGESTRPQSVAVDEPEELRRVVAVVEQLNGREAECVISVDTTKPEVARACLEKGAAIINDISGLRFAPQLARHIAEHNAGLILMHSLGERDSLHTTAAVADVINHISADWRRAIATAERYGVRHSQLALDVGFGFGKTFAQNLELLACLDELVSEFAAFPIVIGTSRKRFIGKLLNDAPVDQRLYGSLATVAVACMKGACVFRVHDVAPSVEALRVIDAVRSASRDLLA